MPERKEATQDMYITELQKDGERTRTLLEEFRQDLGCLAKKQDKIIDTLSQMASDERASRVATDMRIEKLENGLTAVHARVDPIESDVRDLKAAPGKRAETQVRGFWKAVAQYGIGGAIMLLILGIKEWVRGV